MRGASVKGDDEGALAAAGGDEETQHRSGRKERNRTHRYSTSREKKQLRGRGESISERWAQTRWTN